MLSSWPIAMSNMINAASLAPKMALPNLACRRFNVATTKSAPSPTRRSALPLSTRHYRLRRLVALELGDQRIYNGTRSMILTPETSTASQGADQDAT